MKKNNRKGFTIVELVIVIAVIGILATVLVPTFSNITSKANNSAALQEARNTYTEYLAHDSIKGMAADVVYVKVDNVYFKFANGQIVQENDAVKTFDAPEYTAGTQIVEWTTSNSGKVLDIKTVCADNAHVNEKPDDNKDDKCDVCGMTMPVDDEDK